MKHPSFIKRVLSVLSVFAVLAAISVMGFSAAAEDHIVIAIHNTGSDPHDNPIIRTFLPKDLFGSGGPFTIKAEYMVENLTKKTAKNEAIMLADIYTKESMGDEKTQQQRQFTLRDQKSSNGWQELKANEGENKGNYITFNNVEYLPMGSDFPEHYIFNLALCWGKGDLYVRNFRIENAAGEVVYSWDTDEDLIELLEGKDKANLNDIGEVNPEALNVATGFGSGSADYVVSRGDADLPQATEGPAYETTTNGGGNATTTNNGGSNNTTTGNGGGNTTTGSDSSGGSTDAGETTTGGGSTAATSGDSSNNTPAGVTTVPNASNPDGGEGGGLGAGWIVLIVVGGLIVAAGIAFGVLFALKKLPFQKTGDDSNAPLE